MVYARSVYSSGKKKSLRTTGVLDLSEPVNIDQHASR